MGGRYFAFRIGHELKKKTALFQKQFPQNPPFKSFISLADWRKGQGKFFTNGPVHLEREQTAPDALKKEFQDLKEGRFLFFSSSILDLGPDYDWVTNPDSGFKYDETRHWTKVNDFSREAGDIKYVWEKSRFSFLYTIMRYDACTGEEHAEWVWKEILSWIAANPVNSGPNFKCSQEISLRVLNWTYALHFYKSSPSLKEEIFQKIIFSIYWQLRHVYGNIHFSRIAVRNNHAITETLTLYLGGLLYPFFSEAGLWKEKGKRWFEDEVAYQIYEDGTFLQFSMNYHRVVIQLLTWGICLADLNRDRFKEEVYDRAEKSLRFLTNCMNSENGWLPNYGANDGALFFKFNDNNYRDFRPQLEALSLALGKKWIYGAHEDASWYGLTKGTHLTEAVKAEIGSVKFEKGGYYLFRQQDFFTFIRCGKHKDRPSQADNLHLDIWHSGLNLLHDGGSFKYNTSEKELKYFMGTQSHNTVMLDDFDQMEKGSRFIWYHWSQCEGVKVIENENFYHFEGRLKAFQHLDPKIRQLRKFTIHKNKPLFEVQDTILNKPKRVSLNQVWHTHYPELLSFRGELAGGSLLEPEIKEGFYSGFYGKKESCTEIIFSTKEDIIKTYISLKE